MRAPLRLGAATALAAVTALAGLVAPAGAAKPAERGPSVRAAAAPLVPLVRKDRTLAQRATASLTGGSARVSAPVEGPALSTWQVTYSGFDAGSNPDGPAAQAAFQAAVDIWSRLVASPVPIKVAASFASLPSGVLGSAGASSYYSLGGQSWLPSALADAVHGSDVAPLAGGPGTDITAQFTNRPGAGFSFSTTGSTPSGTVDFMSVVMHEIGHGLGFAGSLEVAGGLGSYSAPVPVVYDRFAYDAPVGGTSVLSRPNDSTALASVLQGSSLWWSGAEAVAAEGGSRPRLYAPASWDDGSSFSHLDEATYGFGDPDSLMTPSISASEVIHSPGPIALGMLRDMGWDASLPAPTPDPDPLPDLLPPVLALVGAPASLTRSTTAAFAFSALDDSGVPSVLCSLDGAPATACPASYAGLADGPHRLDAVARDDAGNSSLPVTWSWTVDATRPALAVAAVSPFTTGSTAPVRWSASDGGSGIASYRVRTRRAPWNGGFGAWSSPAVTTSPQLAVAAPRGWTTCTSVLAVDVAGNASAWSPERCSSAPLDDRAVTGSGAWRRLSSLATWLGTFTRATSTGSRLVLTGAVGRRVGLVATTCPTCGSVTVSFGGTVRVLSLVSPTTRHRVLLGVDTGGVRAGTVSVTTRSGRSVLVDGLGVSRT